MSLQESPLTSLPGSGSVEELMGLYGPFSFSELLLQRLWLRREFDVRQARTTSGRRIRVLHPGKWNRLGGPDFKGAHLLLDDEAVQGDVEVHLRVSDWAAHGHSRDPAYAGVVLHVVLFPTTESMTAGVGDRPIPVLALLPLLFHDLEEYAAQAAVEGLANRPSVRIMEQLGGLETGALVALLRRQARKRWEQKVHFARLRIERLGWDAACHHAALEILGHRFNRVPMLRLAAAHPLERWVNGGVDPAKVHAEEADGWSLQGVRPANQPRTRLRQYAEWTKACPDWPGLLIDFANTMPSIDPEDGDVAHVRRRHGFSEVRTGFGHGVCAGVLGGPRLDNLICDGFLPLLAGRRAGNAADNGTWWFNWYPGDLPVHLGRGLRDLGVMGGSASPSCHGLIQGLLGWLLSRD